MGIATTDKVERGEALHMAPRTLVLPHSFATVAVSLKPCALTAPYLLFSLCNLWHWTLCPPARGRGVAVAGGGREDLRDDKRLRLLSMSHRLAGSYCGLHLFLVYFFGVYVDGKSAAMSCAWSQALGLTPVGQWPWNTWACLSCLLCLFLASLARRYTSSRTVSTWPEMQRPHAPASPSLRHRTSPSARRLSHSVPEIEECLLRVSDNDSLATAGNIGPAERMMAGDTRETENSASREAQVQYNTRGEQAAELCLESGWQWQGLVPLACGVAVLVWAMVLPSLMSLLLLVGALVLVCMTSAASHALPGVTLHRPSTWASRLLAWQVLVVVATMASMIVAIQFTVEVVWLAARSCSHRDDEAKQGGGLSSASLYTLLGLGPFEANCAINSASSLDSSMAWPTCTGVVSLLLQQSILHLVCLCAKMEQRVDRYYSDRGRRPQGEAHSPDALADNGAEYGHAQARRQMVVLRWSGRCLGIAGVIFLFVEGLTAVDVKHCGFLVLAVTYCSAAASSSTRPHRWKGILYLACCTVLDLVWHFNVLPAVPILGLGVARDKPLWSFHSVGGQVLVYILLTQHHLCLVKASALANYLPDGPTSQASSGSADPGEAHIPSQSSPSQTSMSGWPCTQGAIGTAHQLVRDLALLWRATGFCLVYAGMFAYAFGFLSFSQANSASGPNLMNIWYLAAAFALVILHCLCGWGASGATSGLVQVRRLWYGVVSCCLALTALRYLAQFNEISDLLDRDLPSDIRNDLGLAFAPGGNTLRWLIGDVLIVALMLIQPWLLEQALRSQHGGAEQGNVSNQAAWILSCRNLLDVAMDSFGDAVLQVVLFLAVDRRQSVIGLGYLLFTVFFLMRPHLITRLCLFPLVYAQGICLLQLVCGFKTVAKWLQTLDPLCDKGLEHGKTCWRDWIGIDKMESWSDAAELLQLLAPDLLVIVSSALIISRARFLQDLRRAPLPRISGIGNGERASVLLMSQDAQRQRFVQAFGSVPLVVSFHAAVAALLLSAHLAHTAMCPVFLVLALVIFFVPGTRSRLAGGRSTCCNDTRYHLILAWRSVLLLLSVLVLAHKVMDLWYTLPFNQVDSDSAARWGLEQSCLNKWLAIIPLTPFEERQQQLTFVLSMLMISAHLRAAVKARAILAPPGPLEQSARHGILTTPPDTSQHARNDGEDEGECEGTPRSSPLLDEAQRRALSPSVTLSGEHWRTGPLLRDTSASDGHNDDGAESSEEAAWSRDSTGKTWVGWSSAQAAIGLALVALFYVFAAAPSGHIPSDPQTPRDLVPSTALAPVLQVLIMLHALVAKSSIHTLCRLLQILVCVLLALDAVFQVPVSPLYNTPMLKSPSQPWQVECLHNATDLSRAAEAAGVHIASGSVDWAPVSAFLILMALQLLIESDWYQSLEEEQRQRERRALDRGQAWFSAQRLHRARAMLAGRAVLHRSRLRVLDLRRLIAASKQSSQTSEEPLAQPSTKGPDLGRRMGAENEGGPVSPQRGVSYAAEKAAAILATPNLPMAVEEHNSALRTREASSGDTAGVRAVEDAAEPNLNTEGQEDEIRQGAQMHAVAEGMLTKATRLVLVAFLKCILALRQTGPLLELDGALKPRLPLQGLSVWRLLELALDEIAHFLSTYTHMMCYVALVLSHVLLRTPASGVAVLFVLVMATFQEPYPARWYWNATILYLAIVSGGKMILRFLQPRTCGTIREPSPRGARAEGPWPVDTSWICAQFLPDLDVFLGGGGTSADDVDVYGWLCVVDFVALLVVAAHRSNMQQRGLWRDVGPQDLVPTPSELAQAQDEMHATWSPNAQSIAVAPEPSPLSTGQSSRLDSTRDDAGAAGGVALREALASGGLNSPRIQVDSGAVRRRRGSCQTARDSHAGDGHGALRREGGNRRGFDADSGGGERGRTVRSVKVVAGWNLGAVRWWLEKKKLVWIGPSSDALAQDAMGTGKDLYLWIVTPELLSLVVIFIGLLLSGSDTDAVANKLQTLASGSVVDWQTLGWVFLAVFQFVVIVMDRVLYLRRSISTKALLQLVTLIVFFCLFFLNVREPHLAASQGFVLLLFMLKCCYWIFSARQIRLGFPKGLDMHAQSSNSFFRDFSFSGYCAYMLYLSMPFLSDMRCMLDWTCTPTTLDFFQWLTLENIYSVLYQREVTLAYRRTFQRHFGHAQPVAIKFSTGVSFFSALAVVIWGPLLVSVISAKYAEPRSTPIVAVGMQVVLATYGPSGDDRFPLAELASFAQAPIKVETNCNMGPNSSMWNLTEWLPKDGTTQKMALDLLHSECSLKDSFSSVYMSSEHDMWQPTPKRRATLAAALDAALSDADASQAPVEGDAHGTLDECDQGQGSQLARSLPARQGPDTHGPWHGPWIGRPGISPGAAMQVRLQVMVEFRRNTTGLITASQDGELVSTVVQVHESAPWDADLLHQMHDILSAGQGWLVVPNVVNPFVKLSADASVALLSKSSVLEGVNLTLNSLGTGSSQWWSICCDADSDYCRESAANPVLRDDDGCAGIWFLTSSQPLGGGVFSRFGLSLITIYTIFVLALGRTVRSNISGLITYIIYNELASTNKLWALCNDIYAARYHGDLAMEEELFAMLVDIYRSPDTLLQLSGQQSAASRLL